MFKGQEDMIIFKCMNDNYPSMPMWQASFI